MDIIKGSSGRLMAFLIVASWLLICALKTEVTDIPSSWAMMAVAFYFLRNMPPELFLAVINKLYGVKPELKGPSA